jgi:hypothetical protein
LKRQLLETLLVVHLWALPHDVITVEASYMHAITASSHNQSSSHAVCNLSRKYRHHAQGPLLLISWRYLPHTGTAPS